MKQKNEKSSLGTTIGYGLGSMVRTGENLWGFYLSYFLVTVADINAAVAGTISGAALLIASIWCVIIGYISDNSRSKYGKRRPIMLASIFPTAILMALIFIKVDFGSATVIYYAAICILFYIMYYTFLVPYDSLGAELTVDYNARTRIRSLCTVILYVSVFLGGTLVMYAQRAFENAGTFDEAGSWSLAVAATCALPMLVFGLVAWASTRGKESVGEPGNELPKENIFKSYMSVLKVKPFLGIAIWAFIYFIGNTITAGLMVYMGVHVLNVSEATASTYFTISTVITFIMAVPANWLANKFGKKNTLLIAMCVYTVAGIYAFIIRPDSYADGLVIAVAYGITNSIALIISYSMVYDIGELNEFKFGENKTAACVGTYTLAMGLAQAIGYSVIGYILAWSGFDAAAAVQSQKVVDTILFSNTLLPVAMMILAGIAVIFLYKITPKNYAALVEALEAKKEGKEYSTEGFKELL